MILKRFAKIEMDPPKGENNVVIKNDQTLPSSDKTPFQCSKQSNIKSGDVVKFLDQDLIDKIVKINPLWEPTLAGLVCRPGEPGKISLSEDCADSVIVELYATDKTFWISCSAQKLQLVVKRSHQTMNYETLPKVTSAEVKISDWSEEDYPFLDGSEDPYPWANNG